MDEKRDDNAAVVDAMKLLGIDPQNGALAPPPIPDLNFLAEPSVPSIAIRIVSGDTSR